MIKMMPQFLKLYTTLLAITFFFCDYQKCQHTNDILDYKLGSNDATMVLQLYGDNRSQCTMDSNINYIIEK